MSTSAPTLPTARSTRSVPRAPTDQPRTPARFLATPPLLRWRPTADLLAVALSWAGVVGALSAATFLATPQRGGLYFILYALVGAALFGVGAPLAWMVAVRWQPGMRAAVEETLG